MVKLGCCKNVLKKNKYNSKNRKSKKGRKKGLKLKPKQTMTKKKRKVKYKERQEKGVEKSSTGLAQHAWNWKKNREKKCLGTKRKVEAECEGISHTA